MSARGFSGLWEFALWAPIWLLSTRFRGREPNPVQVARGPTVPGGGARRMEVTIC